jgi:hypothetical protein
MFNGASGVGGLQELRTRVDYRSFGRGWITGAELEETREKRNNIELSLVLESTEVVRVLDSNSKQFSVTCVR